jgi:hypothetical protein
MDIFDENETTLLSQLVLKVQSKKNLVTPT